MNPNSKNEIKIENFKTEQFVEYLGTLRQIEVKGAYITIFLSFNPHSESKLIFSVYSQEAKSAAEKLKELVGKNVGVLITGDPMRPFRFRIINSKDQISRIAKGERHK